MATNRDRDTRTGQGQGQGKGGDETRTRTPVFKMRQTRLKHPGIFFLCFYIFTNIYLHADYLYGYPTTCRDTKRGSRCVSSPTLFPLSLPLFDNTETGPQRPRKKKKARDASKCVLSFFSKLCVRLSPSHQRTRTRTRDRDTKRAAMPMEWITGRGEKGWR